MKHTFKNIIHPTDYRKSGVSAFTHGLRLALATKGRFIILHNEQDEVEDEVRQGAFPGVRDTLASWGLLDLGAAPESVEEAVGVRVSKIDLAGNTTVGGVVSFIERHEVDLVVLGTAARDGLPRWLKGSVAEQVARKSGVASLFLPHATKGFVDPKTGEVALRNILLPVDQYPSPVAAFQAAAHLIELLDAEAARLHILHIGTLDSSPAIDLPSWLAARTERLTLQGPVVDTIVAAADQVDADLIVMATEGRHGFLDALRGSTTEAVLRRAHRPLLAVPAPG
jgi:nucleotide-binding universal stress UspA family protein